eukprot:m.363906 g.363906  ORF g.363906 m.363906 type:complete len:378 (+) comp24618_c0_seq1:62-1195(+)
MPLGSGLLASAFGIGLFAGLLIGVVGVGGIVLVPLLILLPGIEVQGAIAASLFSYIFAGLAGTITFANQYSIDWKLVLWPVVPSVIGAALGPVTLEYIGDVAIKSILYSVILVSAIISLVKTIVQIKQERNLAAEAARQTKAAALDADSRQALHEGAVAARHGPIPISTLVAPLTHKRDRQLTKGRVAHAIPALPSRFADREKATNMNHAILDLDQILLGCTEHDDPVSIHSNDDLDHAPAIEATSQPITLWWAVLHIFIGIFVGFGSALTGSSGPVLLLPILLPLGWDVVQALCCAQLIQLPIAIASVISYAISRPGVLDYTLGASIAAGIVPMVIIGTLLGKRFPVSILRLIVSIVLIVAGLVLLISLIVQLTSG